MYNGIGLTTPRGSGTNGYVQRNWAAVRVSKDKVTVCTEKDLEVFEATSNKQPNLEILEHERKRKIEVKCMELEDALEEQGFTPSEIEAKVQSFRELLAETGAARSELKRDEFGREIAKETHELADAQQRKNRMLKEAFGISDDYTTAQGFYTDKEEKAKEAPKKEEKPLPPPVESPPRNKRYALVRTPSPEPSKRDKRDKERDKERSKKRKHKSRDRSPSPKREKKKSKKHKKDRHRSRSR